MHSHRNGLTVVEPDDLVLEQLPSGEHAWLRPDLSAMADTDDVDMRGRWDGTWPTFVFRSMTTYALVAPNLQKATEWFVGDTADIELVDCSSMTFEQPTFIGTLEPAQPASNIQRFAERWAPATRPVAFPGTRAAYPVRCRP